MKAAIANLEKAIEHQSSVISANITDTSFSAKRVREQAQVEIERLMKLRAELYKQDCFNNAKPKPKPQAKRNNPNRNKPMNWGKRRPKGKFKPANKVR